MLIASRGNAGRKTTTCTNATAQIYHVKYTRAFTRAQTHTHARTHWWQGGFLNGGIDIVTPVSPLARTSNPAGRSADTTRVHLISWRWPRIRTSLRMRNLGLGSLRERNARRDWAIDGASTRETVASSDMTRAHDTCVSRVAKRCFFRGIMSRFRYTSLLINKYEK